MKEAILKYTHFLVDNYEYFQETIFAVSLVTIGIIGYIVVSLVDKIFDNKDSI